MAVNKFRIHFLYLSEKRLSLKACIFGSKQMAFIYLAFFDDGTAFPYLPVLPRDFLFGADTLSGLVYDNTYHFGCRNDYLKVLLESQDYLNKVSDIAEEYGFNVDYSEETIGIEGDENKDSSDSIVRISEMIQKILNSVDTPQIMYPKEAGSFSTGEINYYSIPCWGQLTCLYHIQGHSAVMTFRFGDESITEENIQDIVTEAIEQTEKNIEEDELSKS